MNLLRRKSVTQLQADALTDQRLKRALGATNLTALGIGAIIGTGIFVLTGTVAAQNAGPAVILSFVLAGVASIFAALCYSEFASLVPMAGSAYTYGYATLGELFAWIIGWDLILEYALGAVTVSIGWSGYVVSFLRDIGIHIPAELSAARGTLITLADGTQVTAIFNLPAVIIIGIVTLLLVIGIRESATVNNVIVFVKVAVVLLFIFGAAHAVNPANWHPFIPANTGVRGHFGWSGVMQGAGIVFFAYIGFDAVSTAAQEAKNPQRDMPVGIIGSLLICTVLYIAVSAVATGIVPYLQLDVPDPIAVAADHAGVGWMASLIKLGAIAGLSSVILVMLLGRLFCGSVHRARSWQSGFDRHSAGICDRLNWHSCAAAARAGAAAHIQNTGGVVRRADGCAVGACSYGFAALANLGAADLLVCDRDRDLLRLRHLQLQAWSAQNRRRNRLVACAEDRRRDLDCIRLARLDLVVSAL